MDVILEFFNNLLDPEWLAANYGLYIVMAIIFAETGLFIGFLLPGDHLLFVTGLLLHGYPEPYDTGMANWFYWSSLITLCAVLGNYVGYFIGLKSGNWLFNRKDTWWLKKKHLFQAQRFYEQKGGMAIVVARFIPVVRTFAPIIAGVVKMSFRNFTIFNIIGGAVWVYGLTFIGYLLGTNEWVHNNLGYIIIAVIALTTGPILFKMIFGKSSPEDKAVIEKMMKDREAQNL